MKLTTTQKLLPVGSETGIQTFAFEQFGLQGVNNHPFVNLEPFLNLAKEEYSHMHDKVCIGLAKSEGYRNAFFAGEIPPEFKADLNERPLEAEVLQSLDKYDKSKKHRAAFEGLSVQERRRYLHFALGTHPPWHSTLSLLESSFHEKSNSNSSSWTEDSNHFPDMLNFIKNLKGTLFTDIGRVIFFISYPDTSVPPHRDWLREKHEDHFVNINFGGYRPVFVYDEKKKRKYYLDKNIMAYYFNNRDYHGVDKGNKFQYTLRIDGRFEEEIIKKLGISNGLS